MDTEGVTEQQAIDGHDAQTQQIIGGAIAVHRKLGAGFLEPVYQEALAIELGRRGIPFGREVSLPITYDGILLTCTYKADFICYESIIVELKALAKVGTVEHSQVLNYLKATGLRRAWLINFGGPRLECKRLVR
jgi:GxxExxY protein